MTPSNLPPTRTEQALSFLCLAFILLLGAALWSSISSLSERLMLVFGLAMAACFPLWFTFRPGGGERPVSKEKEVSAHQSGDTREMSVIIGGLHAITGEFRENSKRLETFIDQFATLTDLTELSTRITDIEELLKLVLKKGMGATGSRLGTVMLMRESGEGLEIVASEGWTPSFVGPIKLDETIAGNVVQTGQPLRIMDIERHPDLGRKNDATRYTKSSFLIMPLRARNATIGAVCLSEKSGPEHYSPQDEKFLSVLLGQIGFAVENARTLKQAHDSAKRLAEKVEDLKLQVHQAQQQTFQAEKLSAMGHMIAGVAHELNNPLTAILGYTEILMSGDIDDTIGGKLGTIFNETQRARRIVQNLLAFARDRKDQKAAVDLNRIVENIVSLRHYDLNNHGIDLSTDLLPNLPLTMANADHIQQVLLNLLNNSVQAMSNKTLRQIRIGTKMLDSDRVGFWISDTGNGIAKDIEARIFEPFFSTKPGKFNTGLGLTLSKEIIEEHGGAIRVSSAEGGGTRVSVELPLVTPPPSMTPIEPRFNSEFPKVRDKVALVVDDEKTNADLISEILRDRGFQVDVTTSGSDARRKLMHEIFDLVVCDLLMPEYDGKRLYRDISERRPQIAEKFIFTTGDIADPRTYLFAENNGVRLVTKPFTRQELLQAAYEKLDIDLEVPASQGAGHSN